MSSVKLVFASVSFSFFILSCSSTTTIRSEPSGATLLINGNKVGETPYTYSDSKIMFSKQQVSLKKRGYKSFSSVITRDELAAGPLLAGIFCFFPVLLWSFEYAPFYNFELEKSGENSSLDKKLGPVGWSREYLRVAQTKIPEAEPNVSSIESSVTF